MKKIILGYIEECGPSSVDVLTHVSMAHRQGTWDQIAQPVVDAINELAYDGQIKLTTKGWVATGKKHISWKVKELILEKFDETEPDDSYRIIHKLAGWSDEEIEAFKVKPWHEARKVLFELLAWSDDDQKQKEEYEFQQTMIRIKAKQQIRAKQLS